MQNYVILYSTILRTSNMYITFPPLPPTPHTIKAMYEKIPSKQCLIKFVSGSSVESVFKEVLQDLHAVHSFVCFQIGLIWRQGAGLYLWLEVAAGCSGTGIKVLI